MLHQNIGVPRNLEESNGFAKVYDFGMHGHNYYMTMELCGPSLSELFYFCGSKFSLKTTIMLALQMVERLEYLHK